MALGSLLALAGCQAQLELSVYGEAFVEDQIPAEEVSDGWTIVFDEFLVSMTEIRVEGEETVALDGTWVFDLSQPSEGRGHPLATLAILGGDGASVHYRLAPPDADAQGNATPEQVARAVQQRAALFVGAVASRGDREVRLSWSFPIDQGHRCEIEMDSRGESRAEITIHADHLFLDDLAVDPQLALDLIADADADGDNVVTNSELMATDITGESRYQTGRRDVNDLYRFIGQLALTMGHVNGEGSCEPEFVPERYASLYEGTSRMGDADAGRGADLFGEHCAACHGATGTGDGASGAGLEPTPTDLTQLRSTVLDPGYLHFRIAEGGAFLPYLSTMPALRSSLDDDEITDIVAYVHSIAAAG